MKGSHKGLVLGIILGIILYHLYLQKAKKG